MRIYLNHCETGQVINSSVPGESFIFNLRPSAQVFPWHESHENQQFIYADENFLAIGCSSGKFGIWIDRDLNQVISSPCDTF